mgnify:CR=1 FL=1
MFRKSRPQGVQISNHKRNKKGEQNYEKKNVSDRSSSSSNNYDDDKSGYGGRIFKVGICNYVDDASLNQIVDNIQSRLEELGKEKGVTFDVSYDNCNADASVMEQIISDFQADKVDLMVGVATPVAMRMQSATEGTDTPVDFPQFLIRLVPVW